MSTNVFRASYTVLSTWASGDWERAVEMYFKLKSYTTEAMAEGKEYHEQWHQETLKTKCMPEVFGAKKLNNPLCEIKKVAQIYDWLTLVGVIDLLDAPTIIDYKTGKDSSEVWAGGIQIGVYGVLCTMPGYYDLGEGHKEVTNGVHVNRGEIYHYDQYNKTTDMSIVHITDKMLDDTFNWVISMAGEMHDYFEKQNLYAKFGPHLETVLKDREKFGLNI